MWGALRDWAGARPDLMSVEVIGHSREGLDIPAVTLTNRATGSPEHKSAVMVDANIHAGEVSGNSVAMHWIQDCLQRYGQAQEITALLDRHTVYVVPRIAMDGAHVYLTTPCSHRSSPHTYPYSEAPEGFIEEDVNGDGHILQMRIRSEDGAYAVDDVDPRIMRPRGPGEIGGVYYHVFPEGRVDRTSRTGQLPAFAKARYARRAGMDFNRNFPIRWAGESGQPGAGPYPVSEPELRALVEFIQAHPNIASYVALHTTGGVILRQPSTGDDTTLSQADRRLFTRVADMGAAVSGYHAGSNYAIFATGHEKVLMPGAADDWMYDHLGVLSFTLEIWDLDGRAGAQGYGAVGMRKMMARKPEERLEDQRKIYAWVTREVPQDGVFDWTAHEHPDFGPVEIGGINPKFVLQNPPAHLLEEECVRVSAFLTRLGLCGPRLAISEVSVTALGEDQWRIVAEVVNGGYLPTASTDKGRELTLESVQARLDGDCEIVAGSSPITLGHLDGYGSVGGWSPPSSQRASVEWIVRAPVGQPCTVCFAAPRAGRVEQSVQLR